MNYKCGYCEKEFTSRRSLEVHAPIHTNAKYDCKECGKTYSSLPNLRRHVRSKHAQKGQDASSNTTWSESSQGLYCSDCKLFFNIHDWYNFMVHVQSHDSQP